MVPPTPRKPPVVTQDSRSPLRRGLDALASTWRQSGIGNYLPSPNEVGRGVASFLFPTAMAAGRSVKPTDFLADAALAFVPLGGGRAARPALETAEAIAERRNAIERLLNKQGPEAIHTYLQRPLTAYLPTQNPGLLSRFFSETSERIPAGTQMYRAPSSGQVRPRQGSQSVPLPREVGAEWRPNRVQSAAGSGDLQTLGTLIRGIDRMDTGGNQRFAPGMMAIEAMEDLPGIYNLNDYLASFNNPAFSRSTFGIESVLAPQTRYVVRDFVPDAGEGFPTWYLQAYAR